LSQLADARRLAGTDAPPDSAAANKVPAYGPFFKDDRDLFVNGTSVRTFRREAENQVPILRAFREQGWALSIENPLSASPRRRAERRLSGGVRQLNLRQMPKLIYFSVERGTQRVHWKLINEAAGQRAGRADSHGK